MMLSESLRQAENSFRHGLYNEASSLYTGILSGQLSTKKFDHLKEAKYILHSNIATCHLRENKPSLALEQAKECETLLPTPKSFFLQGLCHTQLQNNKAAIKAYVLAVKCAPVFSDGGPDGENSSNYTISEEKKFVLGCLLQVAFTQDMGAELKSQLLKNGLELEILLSITVLLRDGPSLDMWLDLLFSDRDSYHLTANLELLPILELGEKELEKVLKDMFGDAVGICCNITKGGCHRLHYLIHLLEYTKTNKKHFQTALGPSPLDIVCNTYQKSAAEKEPKTCHATESPPSEAAMDMCYLLNLLLSVGLMERNIEQFGDMWSDLSESSSLIDYINKWLETDEAEKMRDVHIMTADQVSQYLLSLLCSQLRGKVTVILPHLTVLTECDKAQVLGIQGNNMAWKSLVQLCVCNQGLGLLQMSVVLEQLGCPNLGDSVYRVYKRLFLRPSSIMRKSTALNNLHSNFSTITKHLIEQDNILPVLLDSCEDLGDTGRFYLIFFTKQGQISKRSIQGYISSVLDFLSFIEYGCFEESMIWIILKEVGCAIESRVKDSDQLDCLEPKMETRLNLLETSPWPEIERVNINEILAVISSSKTPRRRRRNSSKKLVKEPSQPEELKSFESELADQVGCQSVGLTQVYMPCVPSQPAIASAIIQRHIWYLSESADKDREDVRGEDGTADSETAMKTSVLVVVPGKNAVSYAVNDLNRYLPHLKIGDHGVSADHRKQGKGKGFVHKSGLAKVLQNKDIVVCAEETFSNCLRSSSVAINQMTLVVYLNLDTFSKGFPPSINSQVAAKSMLPTIVMFSKSILQREDTLRTFGVRRHLKDLFDMCFPEVMFQSSALSSGNLLDDSSAQTKQSWDLLRNASSQCYGSMGYLSGLLICEPHGEENNQLKVEECVRDILPASLTVSSLQDITKMPKSKRKGCNLYLIKYHPCIVHVCQDSLSTDVNLVYLKRSGDAYALAGTNLKNVLQCLLFSNLT